MKNKIHDERIEKSKLEVKNEAIYMISFILLVSIIRNVFMLKLPISNYITEIFILGAIWVYVFIRNLWLGNLINVAETVNKKVILLCTIISSITLTMTFAVNNFNLYSSKYSGVFDGLFWAAILVMFIQMFILSLLFYVAMGKIKK